MMIKALRGSFVSVSPDETPQFRELSSGLIMAHTHSIAIRRVLQTGADCKRFKPGMLCLRRTDWTPAQELPDGSELWIEKQLIMGFEKVTVDI